MDISAPPISKKGEKMKTLEQNLEYFIQHQAEIVAEHSGKYVLIVDGAVVGAFDELPEAYFFAIKKYQPGTFSIHHAIPGEAAYRNTFHSRVRTASACI